MTIISLFFNYLERAGAAIAVYVSSQVSSLPENRLRRAMRALTSARPRFALNRSRTSHNAPGWSAWKGSSGPCGRCLHLLPSQHPCRSAPTGLRSPPIATPPGGGKGQTRKAGAWDGMIFRTKGYFLFCNQIVMKIDRYCMPLSDRFLYL